MGIRCPTAALGAEVLRCPQAVVTVVGPDGGVARLCIPTDRATDRHPFPSMSYYIYYT